MIIAPSEVHRYKDQIRHIIFDFGGVLIDLYPERTYEAMTSLLGQEFWPDTMDKELLERFYDFEKGFINQETFLWYLQRVQRKTPLPYQLIKAWNAMLGEWQTDKFDLLLKLKKTYLTYVLSNNNEIHLHTVLNDLKKNHGIEDFNNGYFTKTYYSHLIGMRKPDEVVYHHILSDIGACGEQVLFIEDTYQNALAAASCGLIAVHHTINAPLDYLKVLVE